jgi:hypothetical protein
VAVFPGKRFVLIVSTGRTGTKALAQHLDKCYPQVCALHEPRPSWRLRMATTRALCGKMQRQQLVEKLVRLRRGLISRVSQGIYVESNPYLSGFIEVFPEVFEDARVVHVVRDPRTYVRSGVNFGAFRGTKKLASEWWPNWFPKPAGSRWGEMDSIERLAWFWALVNSHLNRGEEIYGERYLRIGFEELFSPEGEGLERLTDWIGLPRSGAMREEARKEHVNASRVEELAAWDKWPASDQQKVMKHCGDLMRMYGYLPAPVAVEAS